MQLWGKYGDLDWELLDTADEDNTIEFLLGEYALAFGMGWIFEIRGGDRGNVHGAAL